ncbi:MAG: c-type cytochrome [Elusimicrobia bacterium]|nr:c-type cytochrome [Elusimicrobiota bacterium]
MKPPLIALVLLVAACGGAESYAPVGPAAGKAYFTQAGCASCHRIGDVGSAVGPDLTLVGFRHSAQWLDLFIKNPQAWKKNTLMPNKRMSDEARKALVDYLAMLEGQDWERGARPWDAPSLMKDAVARGRVIYARAGCVGCHGVGGAGGYPNNNVAGGLIPALDKVQDGYTKAELIAKIKKGVPRPQKADPEGPAPLIAMPAWGEKLDERELDALASYLLTLRPAKGEKSDW